MGKGYIFVKQKQFLLLRTKKEFKLMNYAHYR